MKGGECVCVCNGLNEGASDRPGERVVVHTMVECKSAAAGCLNE